MKKIYTQPHCSTIAASTSVSMLAASANRVSESGERVTTGGDYGTGDAGYAHTKLWSCGWHEEEENEY